MAELKCGAQNCTYNRSKLCCKGDIMVGGRHAGTSDDTCCESFAERRDGHENFTSSIEHPSRLISIDCEVSNCIYNNNYRCKADHVDIRGGHANRSADTNCATFMER
ncbi:MAG: DUF1540 domain-containing protein [Lachnospiraceae bacterium]|nr:DUF1540 domain-containing protein [Lachnospiraceae bacterium]